MCAERVVDRDAAVALADAQPTGEVVHPERAAEQARETAVDHAAASEHGMRNGSTRTRWGAFSSARWRSDERLAHQAELVLLEVAEPAVHELRALGAGAGGEVVALDERGAQAPAGGVEGAPRRR